MLDTRYTIYLANGVCNLARHVLQGVSTGVDIPVSITQVSTLTASTTVSVVDTFVCLTKISLVAYTGAKWLSLSASISPIASVTAQLQPLQVSPKELCISALNLLRCLQPSYRCKYTLASLQAQHMYAQEGSVHGCARASLSDALHAFHSDSCVKTMP